MSSSAEQQDRRRRLPFVLLLVGLVVGALLALTLDELYEGGPTRAVTGSPRPSPTAGAPQVKVVVPQPAQARTSDSAGVRGTSVAGGDGVTAAPVLSVTGVVDGDVSPGVPATLVVTFANPSSKDVRVTAVSADVVTVRRERAGSCLPAWYDIASYAGDLAVPAGSARQVRLAVTLVDLRDVNQDGCKGARYAFRYSVRAVPA